MGPQAPGRWMSSSCQAPGWRCTWLAPGWWSISRSGGLTALGRRIFAPSPAGKFAWKVKFDNNATVNKFSAGFCVAHMTTFSLMRIFLPVDQGLSKKINYCFLSSILACSFFQEIILLGTHGKRQTQSLPAHSSRRLCYVRTHGKRRIAGPMK